MPFKDFHPAVKEWFESTFSEPTPAQSEAWPAIKQGQHCLIAAPTGSGKTLAAFLAAIDDLVQQSLDSGPLEDQTYVLYVSPLKALSNDIQKNLQLPICGIETALNERGLPSVGIQAKVRTGDTPPSERARMAKFPPHILVTTPESLYILLTSESGRNMLHTVRSVIVDEIHAVVGNKRGAHLSLSLERLQALVVKPLVRIGLSATQKPIEIVSQFLVGARNEPCLIVDSGHNRERDLAIEVTASPLEGLMSNEVWDEVYDRLADLILEHTTTLIFVNNRRLSERATRFLAERVGEENVAAHHGSLAKEHRLDAEQKLKNGKLKAMVATASMELGIDIGDVDLVCQLGSPHGIAAFLQRVGRSGHAVGGLPKGRLFPSSRDDLVECSALLHAIEQGDMDTLEICASPLDVLSQQIIAEVASREWAEDELYRVLTAAYPYRDLSQQAYSQVLAMVADGFATRRGRRSAYIYRDEVNGQLRPRKSARLTAVTNAGAIPDHFDYDVMLEPQGHKIGTLNEDFSIESMPGDIFQLGNQSYRILRVENGIVRVEDAHGLPPSIPFWLGEGAGRTNELSEAVSNLRQQVAERLPESGVDSTTDWVVNTIHICPAAALQLVEYLAATQAALQGMPTQKHIFFERFFDETGDHHIVIHSPYGSRLNRAWGLALRKKFCRKFNFELQAAALEDSIVISLGSTHSFPLEEVIHYLKSTSIEQVVTQAVLQAPLFPTHWRWDASIALAVKRNQSGKRVPAIFQRNNAEDLIAVVFPDQIACQDNIVGEREIPDHPLVNQTIYDCLHQVMDIDGLQQLLEKIETQQVTISCRDLVTPSPLAQEILTAKPYAFLDDAPAEERRTRAVNANRTMDVESARDIGTLDPAAIEQVCSEAWPEVNTTDEAHDALLMLGFITEQEAKHNKWQSLFETLTADKRAALFKFDSEAGPHAIWVCAERLALLRSLFPEGLTSPDIDAVGAASQIDWEPHTALIELVRGRLQGLGPVSEGALAQSLHIKNSDIALACLALEQEGYAMQGQFSPLTPAQLAEDTAPETQWCERGLLARIHRYTLKKLRNEIKPVTPAEFMMFLFDWHHLGEERPEGTLAVANTLRQLEGFSIPACAWETDILPDRVDHFESFAVDQLCMSGEFTWLRFASKSQSNKSKSNKKSSSKGPIKTTPVSFIERQHQAIWLELHQQAQARELELSSSAQLLLSSLQQQGASFFSELHHSHSNPQGMLRNQAETALGELVSNGLVNSDSFAGLRALITPTKKKNEIARRARQRSITPLNSIDNAGRWVLLNRQELSANANGQVATPQEISNQKHRWLQTPYETLEFIAETLLIRYGVVFRKLLERETGLPPWRELLYVFRRLEARGEIRGGRFVDGFSGEQFASPDAVGLLRKQRKKKSDSLITICAADPLNLVGIILPGQRITAQASHRILFKNGVPIAVQQGKQTNYLQPQTPDKEWQIKNILLQRQNPGNFMAPKGKI